MRNSRRGGIVVCALILELGHHVLQNGTITALTCASGSTPRDNQLEE